MHEKKGKWKDTLQVVQELRNKIKAQDIQLSRQANQLHDYKVVLNSKKNALGNMERENASLKREITLRGRRIKQLEARLEKRKGQNTATKNSNTK